MNEPMGIMDYCRQLEMKVREAREQRDSYRLKFIVFCTIGRWPIAFFAGVVTGVLVIGMVELVWRMIWKG
jgi:hypothetical protein